MKNRSRANVVKPSARRAQSLPAQPKSFGRAPPPAEPSGTVPVRKHNDTVQEATDDPAQAEELERQQDA